ncbi:response regulator transcription factor (plasmid) [Azospirillum sp. HJ39]|uniref:response regulator transcription factor n=1 Tax=Azospirillum sp. HJ39 TaxID=3159496 RepID=UPI003557C122
MPDILVVDDDDGLRFDLVDYLNLKGFRTIGAESAAACRQALDRMSPDVVVLDVRLPDGHGFALAREIHARFGVGCGLIMLTGLSTPNDRVDGLESGADTYLVKHATLREIEATIRSVLRRLPVAATAAAETPAAAPAGGQDVGGWRMLRADWTLQAPNAARITLTGTEVAFLEALLAKPGTPRPRADLIAALARPSMRFNDRNLDEVVRRLRRKVEQASGMAVPIRVVYGVGYCFTGDA